MSRTTSRTSPSPRRRWTTTLLVIGIAVIVLGIAGWLLNGLVFDPLIKLARADAEVKRLERDVHQRSGQVKGLQQQIDWGKSPAGSAAIPISKGYLKPGEHTLRVQVAASKTAATAPAPAPTPGGNQRLFWGSLIGAFFAGFIVLFTRWRLTRRRGDDGATIRSRDRVVKDRRLNAARDGA